MSLARQHRDRIAAATLAKAAPILAMGGGLAPPADLDPADPAQRQAAQLMLRLAHDLRRLKDTKAIENKIAVKREVLPAYAAWCDGLLEAGRMTAGDELLPAAGDEILPTMMVWSIDVGDYARALELAAHVLRFRVPLPARYERDAATLVLEEIAEAALRAQVRGEAFPIAVLDQVEELVAGIDMHDEPRAKLAKAIGTELARGADTLEPGTSEHLATVSLALIALKRAQALNDRIGVKTEIKRLEKALGAAPAATETAGAAG